MEVIHIRDSSKYGRIVYIGRTTYGTYHFGNPFTHLPNVTLASVQVNTREEAIRRYKAWLLGEADLNLEQDRRGWILKNLVYLRDNADALACFCAPLPCHGDVLVALINKLTKRRN